jgi:hypothetical protein
MIPWRARFLSCHYPTLSKTPVSFSWSTQWGHKSEQSRTIYVRENWEFFLEISLQRNFFRLYQFFLQRVVWRNRVDNIEKQAGRQIEGHADKQRDTYTER